MALAIMQFVPLLKTFLPHVYVWQCVCAYVVTCAVDGMRVDASPIAYTHTGMPMYEAGSKILKQDKYQLIHWADPKSRPVVIMSVRPSSLFKIFQNKTNFKGNGDRYWLVGLWVCLWNTSLISIV